MKLKELGIIGIFLGRKSTFALIVLAISSVALFMHHLDSSTFGVIISVICSALFAAHSYQQCNSAPSTPSPADPSVVPATPDPSSAPAAPAAPTDPSVTPTPAANLPPRGQIG